VRDFLTVVFSETGMKIGFVLCLVLSAWWIAFIFFLHWRTILASAIGLLSSLTGPTARERFSEVFSFSGRLDRRQFLITRFASHCGAGLLWLFGLWLLDLRSSVTDAVAMISLGLFTLLWLWINCAASAKRTRDTGVTVWWALTLLVPPVNLAATVFLYFVPSDEFAGRGL
jgi:uncharacterized membrane protein YhaH (DUF805 family)